MKSTKENCPADGRFFVNSFIENHAFCKLFEIIETRGSVLLYSEFFSKNQNQRFSNSRTFKEPKLMVQRTAQLLYIYRLKVPGINMGSKEPNSLVRAEAIGFTKVTCEPKPTSDVQVDSQQEEKPCY
jgi:hypothetical protein